MIGRAARQLLMHGRFDSSGNGARQPRRVQDTAGAVQQQMRSNSAGAFAAYLPSHAGRK